MTIEHKDIPDVNIHQTKGVASAPTGTVHAASAGVGTWVAPYTLQTVKETVVLQASQNTTQLIAAQDTPQGVLFGGAQVGADVSIDAAGLITINTTGYYKFKFNLNFGRTTTAGSSFIFARLLINGTPAGFVQGTQLDSANQSIPFQADYDAVLTAGNTVKVEMYRDSAGVANGGLIAVTTPALAGWADVPSAWVRVYKQLGPGN